MKHWLVALIVGAAVAGVLIANDQNRGFSQEDLVNVENAIRAEFGKREGVTVKEVVMLRQSRDQLKGFVKVEAAGIELAQTCEANMSEDLANYIWQCR